MKYSSRILSLIVALVLVASQSLSAQYQLLEPALREGTGLSSRRVAQLAQGYRRMPQNFELNRGQTDPRVRYLSRGKGYAISFTDSEVVLSLCESHAAGGRVDALRMRLAGADGEARVEALDQLPGKTNYLKGDDPQAWITGVPTFGRLRYGGVYPGVDLTYYGNQDQLEYDFAVGPGADPKAIRLSFDGADHIAVNPHGMLEIRTSSGTLFQHKPVIYQEADGSRRSVDGGYQVDCRREVSFWLGQYDSSKPLVIDPVLSYSTYLGGTGVDQANSLALDAHGNAYVGGVTFSADFPVLDPLQPSLQKDANGRDTADAFVTKISASGVLLYSTYLGGDQYDQASGIAVDSTGSAYVAGFTKSDNFPTASPIYPNHQPGVFDEEGFVAKLTPTGSALVYSTHLGGVFNDRINAIALDSAGNAYVTGETSSADFPVRNAIQGTCNCNRKEAFVTKINAAGSALSYSTYLGGAGGVRGGDDIGTALAVDVGGNVYVTGTTSSFDFPTANAFDPSYNDDLDQGFDLTDAFVTKVNAQGTALAYSTFLGGNGDDEATAIAVDSSGSAYVTGTVRSTTFPTTPGAFQPGFIGSSSSPASFVTKFSPSGNSLVYSTFLDGSSFDIANGISVDSAGYAYVTGQTNSTDYPIANPVQFALKGSSDAFLTKLNPAGTGLVLSTFFGGHEKDVATCIAVDALGNAYIGGYTSSTDLPALDALQSGLAGLTDAFVAQLSDPDRNPATVTVMGPRENEGVLSDKPITIQFGAADADGLRGFIVSYSLDGGQIFHDVARLGPNATSVTWNAPDPLISGQMLFRVTAVDRLGNASSAFTRMFRLSPSFFLIPPTLKVLLDFTPPLPGVLTPPLGVRLTVEEVPFQELPIGFNALTNRSVVPPILAGYNVYRAALPNGGQALPGVQQILDPTNLVGSIDIDATSFADIVGTNRGDNFAYSITTFLGDEQISGGSQPVSTDLPVIIKPIWDKKTIFMQARGSFIAREGAVLIVNDQESFPLEIDDSGEFFKVSKNTGSSPSDRKIKKLVKKGRETFLRVRNPDGRESVLKTLKRF